MTCTVLFVCTGNVCRSPMAAALFNAKVHRAGDDGKLVARSVGTWGMENQPPSGHAVTVMAERGIDISNHRSRIITRQDFQADVVIVMTRSHRDALSAEFPQGRPKLHLMSELRDRIFDVDDPYGGILSEYQTTAQELELLIENGYEKIKSWVPDNCR